MDNGYAVLAILAAIVIFIILCIVFKKGFLIPLIGGMPIFIFGLYYFVDALDHLKGFNGFMSAITQEQERYLSQKNDSLIFMVIGGILILLGIIFAIKHGNKKTQNTYNYYGAAAGSTVICSGCGKMIPAGTKFCPDCGSPVNTVPSGQFNLGSGTQAGGNDINNTANAQPEIKEETKPVNKHVCPNCGAKRSASEKFCGKCGTKFE
jgi:ribosomal protein L40E